MTERRERLKRADELRERGWEVVERLGLRERWSEVGRPVLVGSLRFDLMCRPNLDLEIYTKASQVADGLAMMGELAQVPGVRQVFFLNALDSPDQGLYWRVDYQDEQGGLWDIDNWLVARDHPHTGLAQALAVKLTPAQGLAVLGIKDALGPKRKARGVDIYKAVMAGGVRTAAEFLRWQEQNPPQEIELWRPQGM